MLIRSLAFLTLTLVIVSSFSLAQTQPSEADLEKAKKKKELDERVVMMLDQSIGEAASLRLAGNRAIVYAMSGDLYWKFDSKRSRELFQAAAAEVVAYNQDFEREKRESTEIGVPEGFDPNDPRAEILSLIANRDADLALELLIPTRSSLLAEAVAKAVLTDVRAAGAGTGIATGSGFGDPGGSIDQQRANQEIMLEERFKTLAAYSDPERAIKAIKDSLAKGVSTSVLSLLQVVYRKDEKKAVDLSGDVVAKIVNTDLTKNNNDLNGGMSFLQFVARPVPKATPQAKVFSFSDSQGKEIANKMANTFLQPGTTPAISSALTRALPSFEKLLPERIVLLKQRDALNKKSQSAPRNTQGPARFFDPNSRLEDVIAQAAKLPNQRDRTMAYQWVATPIGQIMDDARAKKLIDQIPDSKIRSIAAGQYESVRIGRLTTADKFAEARGAINALTDKKMRVQKLVALAAQFQRKGGEVNIENAKSLMIEAKGMTNPYPDDEDELADLMEVVRGYALVEPDAAFQMFEPVIDQFNEIVQATAVLSKYNKRDRAFKKGELVMKVGGNPGGLLLFRYIPQMQMLGKADIERMSLLADRFGRDDTRTIIRLYVLQGFIKPNNMPPGPQI